MTTTTEVQRQNGDVHALFVNLWRGSMALGAATACDRILSFAATVLAARFGGARAFGAYSLVLTTAYAVACYSGMGMGSSAARFSAQHPPSSEAHRGVVWGLFAICLVAALLGGGVVLGTAEPLARVLLRNAELAPPLRLAAITVAVAIGLECCRGILLGQHRFGGILLLSAVSGAALLTLLPLASRSGPAAMVAAHGAAILIAVITCAISARRIGLLPPGPLPLPAAKQVVGSARPILKFSAVQLSATAGISLAGWWVASLVARSDNSLVQMGLYAVASQFRNLFAIVPGILGQVAFPLLTDEKSREFGGPNRVLIVNTYISALLTVATAGPAVVIAPWLLRVLYGNAYAGAGAAVVLALTTSIVHMTSGPVATRLSFVALKWTGIINASWAAFVIAFGHWLIPNSGAAGACAAFFLSHIFSYALILWRLGQDQNLPRILVALSAGVMATAVALAVSGALYASSPHGGPWGVAALALWMLAFAGIVLFGRSRGWMPGVRFRVAVLARLEL